VYEDRVMRTLGTKRDEVTGNGENYILRSVMICTAHPILAGDKIENKMGRTCSTY
jgi:hypothetical protein